MSEKFLKHSFLSAIDEYFDTKSIHKKEKLVACLQVTVKSMAGTKYPYRNQYL